MFKTNIITPKNAPTSPIWGATYDHPWVYIWENTLSQNTSTYLFLCSDYICLALQHTLTSQKYTNGRWKVVSQKGGWEYLWEGHTTLKTPHLTHSYSSLIYVRMQWFCNVLFVIHLLMQQQQMVSAFICEFHLSHSAAASWCFLLNITHVLWHKQVGVLLRGKHLCNNFVKKGGGWLIFEGVPFSRDYVYGLSG